MPKTRTRVISKKEKRVSISLITGREYEFKYADFKKNSQGRIDVTEGLMTVFVGEDKTIIIPVRSIETMVIFIEKIKV